MNKREIILILNLQMQIFQRHLNQKMWSKGGTISGSTTITLQPLD